MSKEIDPFIEILSAITLGKVSVTTLQGKNTPPILKIHLDKILSDRQIDPSTANPRFYEGAYSNSQGSIKGIYYLVDFDGMDRDAYSGALVAQDAKLLGFTISVVE